MSEQNRMYWGLKELRMLMDEEVALDRIKEKVNALIGLALECRCGDVYNYIVDSQVLVVQDGSEVTQLDTADIKCHWRVNLHHAPGGRIVRVEARRKQ